jgi:hypothetical protein
MFLLNQNNRANWVTKFKCPADTAMHGSLLSSNTYYKSLNELQQFGLIEVEKGINNFKAAKITINKLKYSDENDFIQLPEIQSPERSCTSTIAPLLTALLTTLTEVQTTALTEGLTEVLPALKDIHKTNYQLKITYTPIRKKREIKIKCLFKNSEYFNNINLIEEKIGELYLKYNLNFYYESVLNWSDSKQAMSADWLATFRNFILGDVKKGTEKLKQK